MCNINDTINNKYTNFTNGNNKDKSLVKILLTMMT